MRHHDIPQFLLRAWADTMLDRKVEEMTCTVAQIHGRWPRLRILLSGDSGFANDKLVSWREANRVDFVFGLARNKRLEKALVSQQAEARYLCLASGALARVFRGFRYHTLNIWSRARRVVRKAEHTPQGANPCFVVTSLKHRRLASPRAQSSR